MYPGIEMWVGHGVSRDRRAPAAVCPGTDMGREMESGCCILGLGSFGCRAVGAALGTVVCVMLCFRAAFCGDTVSQGGGSDLGDLSPLRVPCPLPLEEGAPWRVPGLGMPVTRDGPGWDWAEWDISSSLPGQGVPQALAPSPSSQGCSLRN